ncbi:Eukaryotic translation initiation factor 3 subunit E [Cymbomonas tetramitiformis]|uniref:Eukaryotic translation initiation factor 3 subunit E n=1 Tax=Cymbomonas tetramitiformis TaxID=36881 RepID=A0AAE0G068_9CHLO|nr:Eukaryotic translation initiation factor 3 subunit E [Cymbomonas tetramitiformis]KAK3286118.1 Eukaryotic translation initiation factor 3 subunit E [Cymbomonas tetramitiformis]
MAAYDLTSQVGCFLDRHLVFPLLEFLQVKAVYPEREILEAKIELLGKTNMVDFAMDIYKNLNPESEVPEGMAQKKQQVMEKLKKYQEIAAPLVHFLSSPDHVKQLQSDRAYNLQLLETEFQIGSEQIEGLYHYAKFWFDCGNYSAAAELLYHYGTLCTSTDRMVSALWGKFAADILMQDWETAIEDMGRLKDIIDKNTDALGQLQQRTWLMHWALFIFFNHENGRNSIVDLFFQDRYMNAMQTNAHHLLRYLAVALVINKHKRSMLKELIRVIQQEQHGYTDPITDFLDCLFVKYDFDGAQMKLRECEVVLQNDFFLTNCWEEFVENARLFIFETYCRIHKCIDIKMLAEKLNMEHEAAELWVVNMIRTARLQAKIDSKAGTVIMGTQHLNLYEQIIEKTKQLSYRSYKLTNSYMQVVQAQQNPVAVGY